MSLRQNYVMLLNELNLNSVLPVMLAENLVSQEEYRVIQELQGVITERDRRDKVLMALPRKGRDFYSLFCKCVVWSSQIELAERMGFDVSSVEDINKHGGNPPSVPSHLPSATIPSGSPVCQYPSSTATPSPIVFPGPYPRVPTVTENVLVLYCKDELLQVTPEMTMPEHKRSSAEYCQEVSDMVDTLSLLSNKHDDNGDMYQAYKITYDRQSLDGMYVSNSLLWSDNAISSSSIILLLCSPQLAGTLYSSNDVIEMEQSQFNKNSLVSAFTSKTVIPVFLNMPKQLHWIPQPLQHASSYSVNVKVLQKACEGVANEEEWSDRVSQSFQDIAELDDLVKLWKVLRKDGRSTYQSTSNVIPPPREYISQLKLNELAPEVSFVWQELATRLGVPFTAQQRIQRTPVDITQKTIAMFNEWIQCKRQDANKDALIQALRSCKCNAIADRVQKTFT